MTTAHKTPVTSYRDRMKRQGSVRVEVQVRKEDAGLVRDVASALGDPAREAETRVILRERIASVRMREFKALLATAPLEGIDLARPRDFGRETTFLSFLIDTNIISEVRKGARCNPGVEKWWGEVAEGDIWLSTLILGEIRKGVELARRRDPAKASVLEAWLGEVVSGFGDRVLAVDAATAEEWGRMSAIRPVPVIDALLAATAKTNGLTLVTRNEADVAGLGVDVLNPFDP